MIALLCFKTFFCFDSKNLILFKCMFYEALQRKPLKDDVLKASDPAWNKMLHYPQALVIL